MINIASSDARYSWPYASIEPFVGVMRDSALLEIEAFSAVKKSVNAGILGYPITSTYCITCPSPENK